MESGITAAGPVGADHPECWPAAAGGVGHVGEVADYETAVVGGVGVDADAIAARATRVESGGRVDSHVDFAVLDLVKTEALSIVLVQIVDETVS